MISMQVIWYWLHLLGVVLWVGGFFYLIMAFIPAMNAGSASEDRKKIIAQAAGRFRKVSWVAIILLVVTGTINFISRISIAQDAGMPSNQLLPANYMGILGIKLLIVIGLIVHHALRLLEPRELEDGRVGLKSKAVSIVASSMFIVAALLGLVLMTK